MKCQVCKRPGKQRDNLTLCRACRVTLERAIADWMLGIERDLATLEAFDAYCAVRLDAARPPLVAGAVEESLNPAA